MGRGLRLTRRPYAGRHLVSLAAYEYIAAGSAVVVGPIVSAAPRTNWAPGPALKSWEPTLDGNEGQGIVLARDHEYAKVELADGRAVSVKVSRIALCEKEPK